MNSHISVKAMMLMSCLFCLRLAESIYLPTSVSRSNLYENQQQNIRHGRSRSHFTRVNKRISENNLRSVENFLDKSIKTRAFSTISTFNSLLFISEYNSSVTDTLRENRHGPDTGFSNDGRITSPINVERQENPDISIIALNTTEQLNSHRENVKKHNSKREQAQLVRGTDVNTANNTELSNKKNADVDRVSDEGRSVGGNGNLVSSSVDPYFDIEQEEDETYGNEENVLYLDHTLKTNEGTNPRPVLVDVVTRFLRIVESQHLLGENCTAGTHLHLGEGVVDRYAQERFRVEADVAVNRANMLTRLWKYADPSVVLSEYLLHASVFSMVEFDDDIFAAGNCYDQYQYKDYWLFCPYAYRLPEGPILVKDLAVEYKYLSNTSEWFYIARKNAENVIRNYNQFSRGEYVTMLRLLHLLNLFPV